MRKKLTKKATKRKKQSVDRGIRTDVWTLALTPNQRNLAVLTVAEYRHFLKPLVLIGYWNWETLSSLSAQERVNTLERLIHRTAINLRPKYGWYFEKAINNHPSFRKFPKRIATKSKQTKRITNQDLPKGFCKGLYRKSKNINEHIAQTVSTQIMEFAQAYQATVVVFEDLSNWKAKGGKHGSLQKQRFHQWCKDRIVELTTQKFTELGGKIAKVNPKYTSAYAFDGSGLLKRSNKKYSQATFRNGKQYNADLSASYNIGARYWYAVLTNSEFTRVWSGQSSSRTLRTPVTLSSLWGLKASLA